MSLFRKTYEEKANGEDIGLDRLGQRGRQRTILSDGSFNIERRTGNPLDGFHLFQWLVNASWAKYWLIVFLFYGLMNALFAAIYLSIGLQQMNGITHSSLLWDYAYCFFFSTQTFTTVGFGGIHPSGLMSNLVASFEAFLGLMTFCIATGTLYGRFSRPNARFRYSPNIIIAPYKGGRALMFMVANERSANLVEMEARVSFSALEQRGPEQVRGFRQLKLEIDKIMMFPTNWILVHAIDEGSPLQGLSAQDIQELEAEVFILIRGFDETFSQTVYSRYSYAAADFVLGARFRRPFFVDEKTGKTIVDLQQVGLYDLVELPVEITSKVEV